MFHQFPRRRRIHGDNIRSSLGSADIGVSHPGFAHLRRSQIPLAAQFSQSFADTAFVLSHSMPSAPSQVINLRRSDNIENSCQYGNLHSRFRKAWELEKE